MKSGQALYLLCVFLNTTTYWKNKINVGLPTEEQKY